MTQHPIRLIGDTARCPKCGGIYYPDNDQTVCPCTANQPKETAMTAGLEHRYDVRKINDTTGKHDDCRYFVLDPQHDPIARAALATYADEAQRGGFGDLAADLRAWTEGLSTADDPCPTCGVRRDEHADQQTDFPHPLPSLNITSHPFGAVRGDDGARPGRTED